MPTALTLGKTSNPQFVKLPEIPVEWKQETRPQEEKVEQMLLKMGFKPLSEDLRNQLIAAGHHGMPQE
jgi:hypothetical protein